jgi:hypothetical protein
MFLGASGAVIVLVATAVWIGRLLSRRKSSVAPPAP